MKTKDIGKDFSKPNVLMGAKAQVAIEFRCRVSSASLMERKFARYFDVEARIILVSKESHCCLDVAKIHENLDENTIGTM